MVCIFLCFFQKTVSCSCVCFPSPSVSLLSFLSLLLWLLVLLLVVYLDTPSVLQHLHPPPSNVWKNHTTGPPRKCSPRLYIHGTKGEAWSDGGITVCLPAGTISSTSLHRNWKEGEKPPWWLHYLLSRWSPWTLNRIAMQQNNNEKPILTAINECYGIFWFHSLIS